jgi:hypothetical protein
MWGNALVAGGAEVSASSQAWHQASARACDVVDMDNGTYEVRFSQYKPGACEVRVNVEGGDLPAFITMFGPPWPEKKGAGVASGDVVAAHGATALADGDTEALAEDDATDEVLSFEESDTE